MKKLFLIPLLALFACVSAWGTTVQVSSADDLVTAISNADADVIQLTADIDDATTYSITRSLTLDLNGHTITQPTANASLQVLEINASGIEVTIQNGAVVRESYLFDTNKAGYNIQITQAAQVTLNNVTATGGYRTLVINANCHIQGGLYGGVNRVLQVNSGTIQIDGGTFEGPQIMQAYASLGSIDITVTDGIFRAGANQYAVLLYGYAGNTVNMSFSNGEISNGAYGVYVAGNYSSTDVNRASYPVSLTVTGGTIDGAYGGIDLRGKGAEVNIQGGTVTGGYYAITGNGTGNYGGTTINISGGTVGSDSTPWAIYHPQQNSVLNITGGDLIGAETALEIRAGELNISGNPTLTSLSTEQDCQPNGSGTTIIGAALAISQHTTTKPIAVTIDGGTFRGIYPIRQSNPQANAQQYVDLLTLTVNGGKFWATNTEKVAANSENNKLKFRGGYYNLAPHAFVDNGYIAKANDDATTLAEGYLFKVVPFVETPATVEIIDGNWVVEDTWTEDVVPTETSSVTIPDGGEVYIAPTGTDGEVVAYANTLTVESGASLTIQDGATLVLGSDAVVEDGASLVVEEGGQLLIAPSETPVQPKGTVTLVADGAGMKAGKTDYTDAKNLYWQHFAIPTAGAPENIVVKYEGSEVTEPITYFNNWDMTTGWEAIVRSDLTTPFVGYNMSNIKPYNEANPVSYEFKGTLVGNTSNPLLFARDGFSFFGNSYLAPINIKALQASMYEQGMEYTVYIFKKQGNRQIYRPINDVTASIYGIEEIKPLQGFFMYAQEASQANFQYNSAVYSAFINKQNGGASNNAPARRVANYDAQVIIGIESLNGEYDEVVLVENEKFSDAYDQKEDARKMEQNGINLYADGGFDKLAVMATNNLMGQTLSFISADDIQYTMTFSNVQGELAIRDNVTGNVVAINEGNTYTFAAQPNSTMEGRFEIVGRHEVPTAIENTEVKSNVKGIYTITGQYVGEDFKAIPAGVYVVNGVKIVK